MADEDAGLPTLDEIARLPRWAIVAFAARCARRALPLFQSGWPGASEMYVQAIERAVGMAEMSIAERGAKADAAAIRHAAYAADRAAADAFAAAAFTTTPAVGAARAAQLAANAAANATDNRDNAEDNPAIAASTGRVAASAGVAVAEIRSDFDRLVRAAARDRWNKNTSVPPSFFPPLLNASDHAEPPAKGE